jgi:hypothetical protein
MTPLVVLKGSTPTIVTYPRTTAGEAPLQVPVNAEHRVASASTPWPDEDTGWTASTIDAYAGTVATLAEEGARELTVDDTTGAVVGRRYLVVDADATHVIEVEAVVSSTVLRVSVPLAREVGAGAVVTGWAVLVALTTDETEQVGGAVVHVRCDVGSASTAWTEALRVARRLPVVPLTGPELVSAYPVIKQLRSRQDETLEQVIAAAWEHVVLPRVLRKSAYPEDIVDASVLRPVLALACVLHVARQERSVAPDYVARWSEEFDRLLENTVGRIDWFEAPQDETIPVVPDPEDRRRGVRLTR